ncbi:MAG: hypothetical protein HN712_06875 [Gemmatimonadetes bacterium]|jgi:hypothetical protein|nr:hypothetical protein [Gemmatimonadota bacterium]MBT6146934.1 hypothetical protein [Gemmatimonadota bacterium]MBT7860018.1 hypothetical protein [Gemmatimonadota bacterium]
MIPRVLFGPVLCLGLLGFLTACGPEEAAPGPFEQVEEQTWRAVNASHSGADGLFVQATFHTFGYELSRLYAQAEKAGLVRDQLESRIRQFVYGYIDGRYPMEDGTDINSLYLQYLIYVNPGFDVSNPIEKSQFDVWRSEYVRRFLGKVYDLKYPLLRPDYDERWGNTLYSRLVFSIYVKDENFEGPRQRVADLGARTFLIDEDGNRYAASGTAGPYPYDFDRPEFEYLGDETVYRLYFPNRRVDRQTPILTSATQKLHLVVEGLGDIPSRQMSWDLPIQYPEVPYKYLPTPAPG